MTIDEIRQAVEYNMAMELFDAITGEVYSVESLKSGNEMNYIHYKAEVCILQLLDNYAALIDGYKQLSDLFDWLSTIKLKDILNEEV